MRRNVWRAVSRVVVVSVLSTALVGASAVGAHAGGADEQGTTAVISGSVLGALDDVGVPGVEVVVLTSSGNLVEAGVTETTGDFVFSDLAAGDYLLAVQPVAPYERVYWPNSRDLAGAELVSLSSGEVRRGVGFFLPGASSTSESSHGVVAPDPAAAALLVASDAEAVGHVDSDADSSVLDVEADSAPTADVRQDAGARDGAEVTVEGANDVSTLQSDNGVVSLSGRVTSEDTGAPLLGVSVSVLYPNSWARSAATDVNGEWHVSGESLPGKVTVTFIPRGGSPFILTSYEVDVTPGGVFTGIDAALKTGASIHGTVTRADTGEPLEGVSVHASVDAEGIYSEADAITGHDGTYTIQPLTAGRVTLSFLPYGLPSFAPQYLGGATTEDAAQTLEVAFSDSLDGVDAALVRGGSITGTVKEARTGNPVNGGLVYVEGAGEITQASGSIRADGTYVVTGLAASNYRVKFVMRGTGLADQYWRDARVADGAELVHVGAGVTVGGIDATLNPLGTIKGRVTDEETEAPIPGVTVTLEGAAVYVPEVTTDIDGWYEIAGVPAGSYTVLFTPPFGSPLVAERWDGATDYFVDPSTIHLADGESATGIDASLVAGGSVSGRVLVDGDIWPTGWPHQIYVYVVQADASGYLGSYASGPASALVDEYGEFLIDNVPPGTYKLYAASVYAQELILPGYSLSPITVAAASVVSNIDVDLKRGVGIAGTVRYGDDAETAPASAFATAYLWDGVQWEATRRISVTGDYWFGSEDAGGALRPGTYAIGFEATGYCPVFWPEGTSPETAASIVPEIGHSVGNIDVILQPGCAPAPQVTPAEPVVEGVPRVGEQMTVAAGVWKPAATELHYVWLADGVPIPEATARTYVPGLSDVGKRLSVRVTGSSPGYDSATVDSQVTAPIAATPLTPTVKTGSLTVRGDLRVGGQLTATSQGWSPDGVHVSYQWYIDGRPIADATQSTLTILETYVGATVSVVATGTYDGCTSAEATVVVGSVEASLRVFVASVKYGEAFRLTGAYFAPGERITLTLASGVILATAIVGADGAFEIDVPASDAFSVGANEIRAQGADSSRTGSVWVDVEPASARSPETGVNRVDHRLPQSGGTLPDTLLLVALGFIMVGVGLVRRARSS